MKRRGLTYAQLADKLTAAGHRASNGKPENERNLRNKVARGTFTAAFLLECLAVIGCNTVRIDDLVEVS